jgi:hypothetical protein
VGHGAVLDAGEKRRQDSPIPGIESRNSRQLSIAFHTDSSELLHVGHNKEFPFKRCGSVGLSAEWRLPRPVRSKVLTAVTMKNVVFWVITTQLVLHREHITSPLQTTVC